MLSDFHPNKLFLSIHACLLNSESCQFVLSTCSVGYCAQDCQLLALGSEQNGRVGTSND